MLSPLEKEMIADAVHAVIDEDYRRVGLPPFSVARLRDRAVKYQLLTQAVADDPGTAALIEAKIDAIVAIDEARGDDDRIRSVEPIIPGVRLWQYG